MSDEANTGPLDQNTATEAFSSFLGADDPNENETLTDDTPEAAAEKLAKQELSGNEEEQAPEVEGEPVEASAGNDVTIEVDGKAVTLSKAELADYYKNGLRQKDYTQKTMEVADARKTAEAETTKARQERDQYAQKLNHFAMQTNAELQQQAQMLTQELAESDPQEYLIQKHIFDQRQMQLAQAQQELQHIGQQQQTEQADAMKRHFEQQQEFLLAKLPEWKDPAKAEAESKQIKQYLSSMEFQPQEQSFDDHRMILLARKAMQYDALIERAGKAVKRITPLPAKVERPGSAEVQKTDGRTMAMKQLAKTGSVRDAANAFASIL